MRHRRSSAHVRLVLIGITATPPGCNDDPVVRDLYANQQDRMAGWGSESKCEPMANSSCPRGVHRQLGVLPKFDNRYALIGSWVAEDTAHETGVREDASPPTQTTSTFTPHYFVD